MNAKPVREAGTDPRLLLASLLGTLIATQAIAGEEPQTPMVGPAGSESALWSTDVSTRPDGEQSLMRISSGWPATGFWSSRPFLALPEIEPPLFVVATPTPRGKVPFPPRRPIEFRRVSPFKAAPEIITPDIAAIAGDCHTQLRAYGTTYAPAGQLGSNPACGIDNPVRVSAISRAAGGSISLSDRPVVACRLAVRFAEWVRATAPVLDATHGAPLISITTGPGWDCRTRNRQPGAKLSSHGRGLALDVNAWSFANQAKLTVTGSGGKPTFQAVRRAACAWFTTVLGPGSDGFHQDHLHVDIESHGRGRSRMCR